MSTDFTTWDRATLEQFARDARDELVRTHKLVQAADAYAKVFSIEGPPRVGAHRLLMQAIKNLEPK